MPRKISIGAQDFARIRERDNFYIDKTFFIKQWWENEDVVTLITRPRRFGKTLTVSMMDYFFSNRHKDKAHLFEDLFIWSDEGYRELQGTYPVISLSFAGVKQTSLRKTYGVICEILYETYCRFDDLMGESRVSGEDRSEFNRNKILLREEKEKKTMDYTDNVELSLRVLSRFLAKYYDRNVLIFLDEYDTPMQEAYMNGFWDEMTSFIRSMFNNTFKSNPYMERAILTGITRVSKESVFSDLNNLEVITTSTNKYETVFGFTENEVFSAMDEMALTDRELVKEWYDGFVFGGASNIYNPWSITNYLNEREIGIYWANTSGNGLVGQLLSQGDKAIKMDFERLLSGESIRTPMDEQIVFDQLDKKEGAVWSLLVASGYLKIMDREGNVDSHGNRIKSPRYTLSITNLETRTMFENMVDEWFGKSRSDYNDFVKALLGNNIREMNSYMNRVALQSFSYLDTGKSPSNKAPERFYHGFVLGLLVKLSDRYELKSNRESGYGRYDVMLIPKDQKDPGYILEFKVIDPDEEHSLQETAASALAQIEERKYESELLNRGILKQNIHKYGFAFEGKNVLIVGK